MKCNHERGGIVMNPRTAEYTNPSSPPKKEEKL